jgi:hypothetical protein
MANKSIRLEPIRATHTDAEFQYGVVEYARSKRTVLGVYPTREAAQSAAQAEAEARSWNAGNR